MPGRSSQRRSFQGVDHDAQVTTFAYQQQAFAIERHRAGIVALVARHVSQITKGADGAKDVAMRPAGGE
jgi:hypothetical protein